VQRSIPIIVSLVLSAGAVPAHAGGFLTAHYAGEQGHVATDNPTAIYFNPAGLALGVGWRIYAEGLLAWRTVTYRRPAGAISNVVGDGAGAGTPESAVDANSGKSTLSNFAAAPFLAVVTDLGVPNLGVAAGVYVPFGGQASWDKNDAFEGDTQYPGAVDGVQRWATIDGELKSLYTTLAGAYRLPGSRLSIGAGVSLVMSNTYTTRARTPQGNDDLVNAAGDVAEGRSLIDVSGVSVAATLGVNWEAMPGLWLAASYQSQPGFGNSTQSGTLTNKFGAGSTDPTDIRFEQELPDVIRLGTRYKPSDRLELRLAGDLQRWSVFEHQCLLDSEADPDAKCELEEDGTASEPGQPIIVNIPRQWKDTYGVRAGASYWFVPALEVNGGVAFDSAAVPDETIDASLVDQNKVFARAGIRWAAIPDQLLLGLTVNNVFYFRRKVEPREGAVIGTMAPSTVPDGAGTYKSNVLFFNVGAEYRF
jgi:long-chain fatty acid transport protein